GFLFVAAKPVILVALGAKWLEAAPVFQILAISALGQLLIEPVNWLLVSRGQSKRLLKLLLSVCPVIVAGDLIWLPFCIDGVALTGSLTMLAVLAPMMKYAFRETRLTLPRLGNTISWPIALSLLGIAGAKLALGVLAPVSTASQLLVAALGFILPFL